MLSVVDDPVVVESELRDANSLGRVAGHGSQEVGHDAPDARLVYATRACLLDRDAPGRAAHALRRSKQQIFDARDAGLRAHEELGGLYEVRVAGAASKLFVDHATGAVLVCDAMGRSLVGVRVEESVREAKNVGGEAVAADVRRLPDRVARVVAQRVVNGK